MTVWRSLFAGTAPSSQLPQQIYAIRHDEKPAYPPVASHGLLQCNRGPVETVR